MRIRPVKGCTNGVSCSADDLGIGIQGQYHIMPAASADPWLGLGFGYEVLGVSESAGGQSADVSFKGLEFLTLQGGADFKVADPVAVGPFVSFSLGKYSTQTNSGALGDQSGDIPNTAVHEWLTLGVKGTFGL
jgi:outer membrane protein W